MSDCRNFRLLIHASRWRNSGRIAVVVLCNMERVDGECEEGKPSEPVVCSVCYFFSDSDVRGFQAWFNYPDIAAAGHLDFRTEP